MVINAMVYSKSVRKAYACKNIYRYAVARAGFSYRGAQRTIPEGLKSLQHGVWANRILTS